MSKKFITLGQLLKLKGFVQSGGEAKHRMNEFEIFVNDEPDNRRGRKLYQNDIVVIDKQKIIVKIDES